MDDSTKERRKRAVLILNELSNASRRPLFTELELIRQRDEGFGGVCPSLRTWNEMVEEASCVLPYFTDDEHGKVLRICSILLLGYMLPHSTGNDFRLLQTSNSGPQDESEIEQFLLDIPLEVRLDVGYRSSNLAQSYELGDGSKSPMLDPYIGPNMDRFLDSLASLLQKRPLSGSGGDILHVLAMAIHAAPIRSLGSLVDPNHPAAVRTRRLISHIAAFHLYVPNRRRLIELVEESVALPSLLNEVDTLGCTALMTGPLPHLLASLRARGECEHAIVRIVAQTKNFQWFLQPEWNRFFQAIVDDGVAVCGPRCSSGQNRRDSPCYCLSRGKCMAMLVQRCSHMIEFQDLVLTSLSDAIEWQADSWKEAKKLNTYPPCLLAALIRAVSSVFRPAVAKPETDFESLVGLSIQLLVHPSSLVAKEASQLLLQYLISTGPTETKKYTRAIASALRLCPYKDVGNNLVSYLSCHSAEFSDDIMGHALDNIGSQKCPNAFLWISMIAANSPNSGMLQKDRLEALLAEEKFSEEQKFHVASALLSTRLAHFFIREIDLSSVEKYASTMPDSWLLYKLGVSALASGNHHIAAKTFLRLQELEMIETHYLWASVLEKVSLVGSVLANNGAMGIPDALDNLASALEYTVHVAASPDWDGDGLFQKGYLLLFMDLLDLLTALRHIAKEIRLSAALPRKNTRTLLHLRNVPRTFGELHRRYRRLRFQHGATFRFQESANQLEIIADVCTFFEHATQAAFPEVFKKKRGTKAPAKTSFLCKGDSVIAFLMRKLDTILLQPMSTAVEPLVRAAALIELIDGVLQAPFPFPRDFVLSAPHTCATLMLSPDELQGTIDDDATLFALPLLCFSFVASGQLPESFVRNCRSPIRSILLWFRLHFRHALSASNVADDDQPEEGAPVDELETEPVQMPDWSSCTPARSSDFLPDNRFYFSVVCPPLSTEGMYSLEVKLGCLDCQGNEWEIPLKQGDSTCPLKVSRALDNIF